MKKLFLCIFAVLLLLTGCQSSGEDQLPEGDTTEITIDGGEDQLPESDTTEITIDGIEKAIQKADSSFCFDTTPIYQLVGAENGWSGYFGDSVVTVYLFSDDAAYQKAVEDYPAVGNYTRNGNFVLETNNEIVTQIFSSFNGDLESVVVPEIPDVVEIVIGQVYSIPDLCEFTVNYAELKKEVLPPNPDSFYTYYAEKDGSTYLDVSISIKNTRTTSRSADEFGTVDVICGDGYEYDSFSIIEESGGTDFTYTSITSIDPLMTGVMHYIASIPNELADDSASPIQLNISILGYDYTMAVR